MTLAGTECAFFVLLWRLPKINPTDFTNYWKDVHGPLCARLPGHKGYWQYHGFKPMSYRLDAGLTDMDQDSCEQIAGIAEVTFGSESDRALMAASSSVLMTDEVNIFHKAIAYTTSMGNSIDYKPDPSRNIANGEENGERFHVLVRANPVIGLAQFRRTILEALTDFLLVDSSLRGLRLHLFEAPDSHRPSVANVSHSQPASEDYQACLEVGFRDETSRKVFFAPDVYGAFASATADVVADLEIYRIQALYCFSTDSRMTIAGQRSPHVAQLIEKLGASNQQSEEIRGLF
jgi:hypothetical protein